MRRFSVGYDHLVLLQCFGFANRPAFDLRVGRRLRDDDLRSLLLRLADDLETAIVCVLCHRGK